MLAPLRETFNHGHYAMFQFYYQCSNLRYLASLITIPKLPQSPPDFLAKPPTKAPKKSQPSNEDRLRREQEEADLARAKELSRQMEEDRIAQQQADRERLAREDMERQRQQELQRQQQDLSQQMEMQRQAELQRLAEEERRRQSFMQQQANQMQHMEQQMLQQRFMELSKGGIRGTVAYILRA